MSRSGGFVGVVGELKYNKVSRQHHEPDSAARVAEERAPVPTIGVIGRGYLHKHVSITGEFTAFKVPESISESFDAKFYDFDIYAPAASTATLPCRAATAR